MQSLSTVTLQMLYDVAKGRISRYHELRKECVLICEEGNTQFTKKSILGGWPGSSKIATTVTFACVRRILEWRGGAAEISERTSRDLNSSLEHANP